ncbi:lipoyl(octanoyl) transferase LipB [Oligoflexia bacterium]|nr:lipoyl(octanoyl) transferase LipB [Oligoflexia bacterium]
MDNLQLLSDAPTALQILDLGLKPYAEVWKYQKDLQRALITGTGKDTLIFCQHYPILTLGRSAKVDNVLAPPEELAEKKIELLKVERGGDVTYHGPGQLVGYPILDLKKKRRDVGWYLRSLEEVIVSTLKELDIKGFRLDGKTGVWTYATQIDKISGFLGPENNVAKIASMGVRISRWCTLHGFALNVDDCSSGFRLINPCGMKGIKITSLAELGKIVSVDQVVPILTENFKRIFCYTT